MSTRQNSGSHFENHQREDELRDGAAHAHRVGAEAREKQDHLTGHELSRQAMEHTQKAHVHTAMAHGESVGALAYSLWEARGRPMGSPDEDWFQAEMAHGHTVAKGSGKHA